jgi:hypothetical protein
MHGSLRVHSFLGLAVFVAWSLFVHARERIAPSRGPAEPRLAPRAPAAKVVPPLDPRLLN